MERLEVIVLAEMYPSDGSPYKMMFVHTRVKEYAKTCRVTVASLQCSRRYVYEGITVVPVHQMVEQGWKCDIVVSHAPLKKHMELLGSYNGPLLVFLHGYEALLTSKYYPEPFFWNFKARAIRRLQPIADFIKLRRLRQFLLKNSRNVHVICVSEWMKTHAGRSLGLDLNNSPFDVSVVSNSANSIFEESSYSWEGSKEYDFVTIRPLDRPKYGIDIVACAARRNPKLKFLVVGEGDYFEHHEKPENLVWRRRFLTPREIPLVLNEARAALMPTRLDAQGVMACECAQYGIPLVTSDIDVCHEMFHRYPQVWFLNNESLPGMLEAVLREISPADRFIDRRFSLRDCIEQELSIIRKHISRAKFVQH